MHGPGWPGILFTSPTSASGQLSVHESDNSSPTFVRTEGARDGVAVVRALVATNGDPGSGTREHEHGHPQACATDVVAVTMCTDSSMQLGLLEPHRDTSKTAAGTDLPVER